VSCTPLTKELTSMRSGVDLTSRLGFSLLVAQA